MELLCKPVSNLLSSHFYCPNETSSRFVDHDMLMRFHWGLAVGHVYAHRQLCTNAGVIWGETNQRFQSGNVPKECPDLSDLGMEEDSCEPSEMDHVGVERPSSATDGSGSESDDEDYIPLDGDDESSVSDEDEWLDINEMYREGDSDDDLYE